MKKKQPIDSYNKFFEKYNIDLDDFLKWGATEAIFCEKKEEVKLAWRSLVFKLFGETQYKKFFQENCLEEIKIYIDKDVQRATDKEQAKKTVYIRSSGRQGGSTEEIIKNYQQMNLFAAELIKDPTNNQRPTRLLKNLTGYHKDGERNIHNYIIAHIWGETQNPLLFECPWNICYLPKIVDPFSGHESTEENTVNGDELKEKRTQKFQQILREKADELFGEFIKEYNTIRDYVQKKIQSMQEGKYKDLIKRSWRRIDV